MARKSYILSDAGHPAFVQHQVELRWIFLQCTRQSRTYSWTEGLPVSHSRVYNFLTTKQPILSSILRIRAVQDRLEDHDGQATQNNTGYLLYGLLIPKCAVVS